MTFGSNSFVPQSMTLLNNRYATPEHHIEYNAQNLPKSIEEVTSDTLPLWERYVLTYDYDGNGEKVHSKLIQRILSWDHTTPVYTDALQYERYYFHNDYELHNEYGVLKEILYLGGDAYTAPACLVRYPNERVYSGEEDEEGTPYPWELYVIVRDIQHNITHVLSEDGRTRTQISQYNEWGYLENSAGSGADPRTSIPTLFLGRGFGSHEQLLEFGLVHMNARLYDPVMGRFLSPDPIIQDPENTQNFNRYTYCFNNPFKYWDPTGMAGITDTLDGGWLPAFIVTAYFDIAKWSETQDKAGEAATIDLITRLQEEDRDRSPSDMAQDFIPIYGEGRLAMRNFTSGDYVLGIYHSVMAGLDVCAGVAALKVLKGGTKAVKWAGKAAKTSTKLLKPLGLGSTGRTVAGNLTEQLAMKEIMSNPAMGRVIKTSLKDARWSGWSKMAWNNAGVEIHYVGKFENGVLKAVDDFKFIGGQ